MIGRLLRRTPPTCGACGGDLQRGAPWCGACGERVDAAPAVDTDGPPPATSSRAQPAARAHVRRRGTAVAVVAVVAGLVAAAVLRAEPARPVLGQLGSVTGVSATGPPPDGLRVAWEHELVRPGEEAQALWSPPSRTVVAAGGLVRVDTRVVDAGTGELVRIGSRVGSVTTALHARVVDGDLVVVDTLTGGVHSRVPAGGLPEVVEGGSGARSGDTSLFAGGATSALVRDDGVLVAELDGTLLPYLDRALQDPAAVPVRRFGGSGRDADLQAPLRLLDVATGAVLLEDGGPGARVADVIGQLAMVASTEHTLGAPGEGVPWTVRLLDAATGEERERRSLVSAEAPRLLGQFDDGTAAVATRSGREVRLRAVPPSGAMRDLGAVAAAGGLDGPYVDASPILAVAGMTRGTLVVAGDGEVRAIDAAGTTLWRHAAVGQPSLALGDGHVALLPDDPTRNTLVLDTTDGTQVASLPPAPPDATRPGGPPPDGVPVGVIEGHVGLADATGAGGGRSTRLRTSRWLHLGTGAAAPVEEVVAPFIGDEPVTGAWMLHGTTPDPSTGRTVPVISVDHERDVLRLLEPREGLVRHELPLPDRDEVAGRFTAPVGATADLFAVWSEAFTDEAEVATYVLDRRAGVVRTVPDLVGVGLLPDRLLAVDVEQDFPEAGLVAVDPRTGERQWTSAAEHAPFGSPARFDEQLYVTGDELRVLAMSLRDGSQEWTHQSDVELGELLVLGPRCVFVATTDGGVVALDRTGGVERWRTAVGTPIVAMTGAGDDVLVGTHDGVVVHLDADGEEVQRIVVGTGPVRAVAALGDTVVAVVEDVVVGLRRDGTGITTRDEVDVP